MKHTFLFLAGLALNAFEADAQTIVTDIDGNTYNTVTIGTQVWMVENLKTTHYRNGDAIPNITDTVKWSDTLVGAYCNFFNIPSYADTYGRLYNWYAVDDSRGLAPTGWHIPTEAELKILTDYLGGESVAGGKLKETGITHWDSPNKGATNQFGFTALPGGQRDSNGYFFFDEVGYFGIWWSSTVVDQYTARNLTMNYSEESAIIGADMKGDGWSVRCISDVAAKINEINQNDNIQIYPNPIYDRLFINNARIENGKIIVYDMLGKSVFANNLNTGMNEINVSMLFKGVYLIQIIGTNSIVERKLIKE